MLSLKLCEPVEPDHGVLDPEDVGETPLGKTPMQRHLAALETAHERRTRARTLTFVPAG